MMKLIDKISCTTESLHLDSYPVTGETVISFNTDPYKVPRSQGEDTFESIKTTLATELNVEPERIECKHNKPLISVSIRCTPEQIKKVLPQLQKPFLKRQELRAKGASLEPRSVHSFG